MQVRVWRFAVASNISVYVLLFNRCLAMPTLYVVLGIGKRVQLCTSSWNTALEESCLTA